MVDIKVFVDIFGNGYYEIIIVVYLFESVVESIFLYEIEVVLEVFFIVMDILIRELDVVDFIICWGIKEIIFFVFFLGEFVIILEMFVVDNLIFEFFLFYSIVDINLVEIIIILKIYLILFF